MEIPESIVIPIKESFNEILKQMNDSVLIEYEIVTEDIFESYKNFLVEFNIFYTKRTKRHPDKRKDILFAKRILSWFMVICLDATTEESKNYKQLRLYE